jgi:8-oxo-dGTP diphosphatase
MSQTKKVYAYITREDRLLVFRHVDYPEAGVQVPGGTLDAGETPQEAVLREAREETGLDDLVLKVDLGSDEYRVAGSPPEQTLLRHFFHLECLRGTPETWQHYEMHPSDGTPAPILFEFSWLPLPEAAGKLDPYFTTQLSRLLETTPGGRE